MWASNNIAIDEVRARATGCHASELWRNASQTVFGEGPVPAPAAVLLISEPARRQAHRLLAEDLQSAAFALRAAG